MSKKVRLKVNGALGIIEGPTSNPGQVWVHLIEEDETYEFQEWELEYLNEDE